MSLAVAKRTMIIAVWSLIASEATFFADRFGMKPIAVSV